MASHLFLPWMALAMCIGSALASRHHILLSTAPAPQPKPNSTEQFLTAHNQPRAEVVVGPLKWSPKLGADASRFARFQRDKKGCEFADLSSSSYGANQAWASYPASPAQVVGSWVEGKKYYNHVNNTCAAGQECGTYTQVVWRKTLELGCAQVTCGKGPTLTICLYFPHGNVEGQSPY